jgi:RNA polymerase sigma-70 factor (ECF subfamily)
MAQSLPKGDIQGRSNPPSETDGFVKRAQTIAKLFEAHNQSLLRYLYFKLGNWEEAQDVAQEAYANLLELENQKVISHLQAYLFRAAHNIAVNRVKQRQIRTHINKVILVSDEEQVVESARFDTITDAQKRLQLVRQIVEELPPKCRMAFLLNKFHNLSYRDIADQMALTESMVRKHVLRAVRYCQERLQSLDEPPSEI